MIRTENGLPTAELGQESETMLKDPKNKELIEQKLNEWEERIEPLLETVRSSEHLGQADYAVRINAKA